MIKSCEYMHDLAHHNQIEVLTPAMQVYSQHRH